MKLTRRISSITMYIYLSKRRYNQSILKRKMI